MKWGIFSFFIFSQNLLARAVAPKSYDLGLKLMKMERYTRANQEFLKFVSQFPSHPLVSHANYYRGEALRKGQNFPEAVKAYEEVIKSSSSEKVRSYSMFGLSEAFRSLGNYQRATRLMTQILLLYPNSPAAGLIDNYFPKLRKKMLRDAEKMKVFSSSNRKGI